MIKIIENRIKSDHATPAFGAAHAVHINNTSRKATLSLLFFIFNLFETLQNKVILQQKYFNPENTFNVNPSADSSSHFLRLAFFAHALYVVYVPLHLLRSVSVFISIV